MSVEELPGYYLEQKVKGRLFCALNEICVDNPTICANNKAIVRLRDMSFFLKDRNLLSSGKYSHDEQINELYDYLRCMLSHMVDAYYDANPDTYFTLAKAFAYDVITVVTRDFGSDVDTVIVCLDMFFCEMYNELEPRRKKYTASLEKEEQNE